MTNEAGAALVAPPWPVVRKNDFGIMGIMNITPDSFYDGGKYQDHDRMMQEVGDMLAGGALVIDIGGESTRPGSAPLRPECEQARILGPIMDILKTFPTCALSVDTWHASTAAKALELGARIINDVTAFGMDPLLLDVLAQYKPGYVLTHNRGLPAAPQKSEDIVYELKTFFAKKLSMLTNAGLPEENIVLDPGIGFGKDLSDNLLIISHIDEFLEFGRPLLVGISMKSIFGQLLGQPMQQRAISVAVATVILYLKGVSWHRVHNVRQARDALLLGKIFHYGSTGGEDGIF